MDHGNAAYWDEQMRLGLMRDLVEEMRLGRQIFEFAERRVKRLTKINHGAIAKKHNVEMHDLDLESVSLVWMSDPSLVLINHNLRDDEYYDCLLHGLLHLTHRGRELTRQHRDGLITQQCVHDFIDQKQAEIQIDDDDLRWELADTGPENPHELAWRLGVTTRILEVRVRYLLSQKAIDADAVGQIEWPDCYDFRCCWGDIDDDDDRHTLPPAQAG